MAGMYSITDIAKKGHERPKSEDTQPHPASSHPNKMNIVAGSQFEAVAFDQHQARNKPASIVRKAQAGSGQASFAAQAASRGIQEAPGGLSAKGNAPVRSAGKKTQAADIDKLKTAGA